MNEQINKKQNNNILQIIIIILLVVLIAIGGMILLKDNKKDNIEKDNNVSENDHNNNNNNNSQNSGTTDFDLSKFDTKKYAINDEDEMAFEPIEQDISTNSGINVTLNSDKKSVTITIDWSKYSNLYMGGSTFSGITTTESRNYNISNFSKNIKNVYIKGFNSSSGFETVMYIMEDGTIEYTPIQKELNNNGILSNTNLKSYGMIQNVSGIVTLIDAIGYYPNNPNALASGSCILAIKSDGSFYDISKILNTSGNY